MYYDLIGFILEMQGWFNIPIFINSIHPIKKLNEKKSIQQIQEKYLINSKPVYDFIKKSHEAKYGKIFP